MSTICAFDDRKSKYDVYRGKDCVKKFYESLKEHAIEIINFKIKKLMLSTKKSLNHMLIKTTVAFAKENLKIWILKNTLKFKIVVICRGAVHITCNIRYKIPKEIPIVFHNGSNYDYHFIRKELAERFKGQSECLPKSIEKYITLLVPVKKKLKILIKLEKKL